MIRISGAAARPVAMFADSSDSAMINAAIDAGVSAYVVDGLKKERVKSIVDLSVSRFNAFARLREELALAQSQLADRKAIDQAKALVMKAKTISEDQAYAMMRKVAMNEGKKIAEIARSHHHGGGAAEMTQHLRIGYMPLTDAGLLFVAAAKGFDREEGLLFELCAGNLLGQSARQAGARHLRRRPHARAGGGRLRRSASTVSPRR